MKTCSSISASLAIAFLFLFSSCSRNATEPPPRSVPHLSYEISIPSVDTVHVSATFFSQESGVIKILFPPFDADNPSITFLGNNIHRLKLTNATVADSLGTSLWLGDSVQSMLVNTPVEGTPFSLEYDVTFPYNPNGSPQFKTILPGRFGQAEGYFQGNYVFCVPAAGTRKSEWWRNPIYALVNLASSPAGPVSGFPEHPFNCFNAYELFFLQWAITDNASSYPPSMSRIVTLSSHQPVSEVTSFICNDLSAIDRICAPVFPSLGAPRTVILQDSGSGMEGLFSFYMQNWSYADFITSSRPVTAHEALHAWVGIRTGDLDDPWWKEGTASYLGRVVGANAGFPKDSLRPQLVKDLSPNLMVMQRALSEAYVRDHLYDKDPNINCAVLVYDKGAQACMLLDKMIRTATNNTVTLFSKTGALCTRFDHSAFSRGQFKSTLEESTGLDLTAFFASTIDRAGFIDTAQLSGAWRYLDSCNAFSGKP
jgi:hypothetical protein